MTIGTFHISITVIIDKLNELNSIMIELKDHQIGAFYGFLSTVLFSAVDLAIKLFEPYLSVWDMMLGRSLFGIVAIAILAKCSGVSLLGHGRGALVIIGLAGTTFIIFLTLALIMLPLFEAMVLIYLYPVFAALLSPRLTGEKMSSLDWLLIALAFIGTILILWPNHLEGQLRWGHLFGLSAAFLNGLILTLIRLVSARNNPLIPVFYINLAGCVICTGPFLWQNLPLQIETRGIMGLLAMSILATYAYLTINKALARLPSPRVGIIGMTEVVLGGVFGFLIFNESLYWRSILGAVLIVGSGICLILKPGREN